MSYKELIPVWREIYDNYCMGACISQLAKQTHTIILCNKYTRERSSRWFFRYRKKEACVIRVEIDTRIL